MEALFTLAVPALIKLAELVNRKDWKSARKIVGAASIGVLAGLVGLAGLDPVTGLGAGLSASGLMTVAGYAGIKAGQTKQTQ